MGCIDVPEKARRRALYGPRHFVQALLVRRLLWERVTADRIVGLVARKSSKETEGMFLYGVEYVARTEGGGGAKAQPTRYRQMLRACAENSVSAWTRVVLGEGIEIHLSDKRSKMTPEQRRQMTKRIEELVKEL